MRRNPTKCLLIVFCISFFHLFSVLPAPCQDARLTAGGFQWGGDIELGYRGTSINGNKDRYDYVSNLQNGLKLFDLSLWGKRIAEDPKSWIDSVRFNVSSLGDPYPSGLLEVKKNNTYSLNINYKQYQYITYREDPNLLFAPSANFDSTIRRGSVLLSLFPKDGVKLNFGYNHVQRDGDAATTVFPTLTPMEQDLNEQYNEYFISADFPIANWDLHVKESYWTYNNGDKIHAPVYQALDSSTQTLVTNVKGHTRFSDRLDFDAAFIYAHTQGTSDITSVPIVTVLPGTGNMVMNTYVVEAGLSYLIRKELIFHLDYRFHALDQNGRANTDVFLGAPANTPSDYNLMANTGTFQLEYIPRDNLTLRAGYRVQYQHIYGDNYYDAGIGNGIGGKNPSSNSSWLNGWVGSIDWKPYKFLTIFGEYEGANFSNPYTWISMENQNVARAKIKYDTPIKGLSLKGTFNWRYTTNAQQNYNLNVQDYIFTVMYKPIPMIAFDGSFDYSRVNNSKDIWNPIPFRYENFVWDSSYYVWTGGLTFDNVYKGFGGRMNGSYAKSLGENPQNYVDAVISVWYKNKCVTPILTYERTYLTDNVVHTNGFSANLVTFSLRKDF
jgi:hypothetical protein